MSLNLLSAPHRGVMQRTPVWYQRCPSQRRDQAAKYRCEMPVPAESKVAKPYSVWVGFKIIMRSATYPIRYGDIEMAHTFGVCLLMLLMLSTVAPLEAQRAMDEDQVKEIVHVLKALVNKARAER